VGFGFGVHFCLGARLEGEITLEALLDRFPEIGPGEGAARRLHSTVIRGFTSLPLEGRRG
jgi:cytochrome P450